MTGRLNKSASFKAALRENVPTPLPWYEGKTAKEGEEKEVNYSELEYRI